jgi:hypothetical protein
MTGAVLKSPGLYLRALESEPPAPTRTAVTAFVGVAERGPLHTPQILSSFGDFLEVFGGSWRWGALGDSVYAFFLNGGEEAAVVRVARLPPLAGDPLGACSVKEDLASAVAAPLLDTSGQPTLTLAARSPGSWGDQIRVDVGRDGVQPIELAHLSAPAAAGSAEIAVDATCDFSVGGQIQLAHRSNPFVKSAHTVQAIDEGTRRLILDPLLPDAYPPGSTLTGLGFRLEVRQGERREIFEGLSMNPDHPRHVVSAVNGSAGEPFVSLARNGHSLLIRAAQVLRPTGRPGGKPVDRADVAFSGGGDGVTSATAVLSDGGGTATLTATARVRGRDGANVNLQAAPFLARLALPVPPRPGAPKDRLTVDDVRGWQAGESVRLVHPSNAGITESATIAEVRPDDHLLVLTAPLANSYPRDSRCDVAGRFNLFIDRTTAPDSQEAFFNLSLAAGPRLFSAVVNDGAAGTPSRLVCLARGNPAAGPPVGTVTLSGGSDADEVPPEQYTGYNADGSLHEWPGEFPRLGLAACEATPEINLVAVPDLSLRRDLSAAERVRIQTQVLVHCQKLGDRFALLDLPAGATLAAAQAFPRNFPDEGIARFGALYHPWLRIAIDGQNRLMPPSGAVAGLVARADRDEGVGRAPANLQLRGVVGLAADLAAAEQGELNLAGVNCLRKFEVGAVRLWGARTLSRQEGHLYVHHRRVLLYTRKALGTGLRWAVFEPNDRVLRQRIKDAVEGFLRGLLARGWAAGDRPDDAFYVRIGDDLNSAATRDAGQLLVEVGIALARPAEFIVIAVKRHPDVLTLVEEEA